jgi:murein DD-endopeptidase MepM/ murein hydrolase activator NlpD
MDIIRKFKLLLALTLALFFSVLSIPMIPAALAAEPAIAQIAAGIYDALVTAMDHYKQNNVSIKSSVVKKEYIWPIAGNEGIIGCPLNCGCKTHKGTHRGVDISGIIAGKDVVAVKLGTVQSKTTCAHTIASKKECRECGGFGTSIELRHEDGKTSRYCHLQADSIPADAVIGKTIKQGAKIGTVGNTGYSKGDHLHFVMRDENGTYLDPEDYIKPTTPR